MTYGSKFRSIIQNANKLLSRNENGMLDFFYFVLQVGWVRADSKAIQAIHTYLIFFPYLIIHKSPIIYVM